MQTEGSESDLCSILRSYIKTISADAGLYHYDAIPMYYLPSWTTRPFYSVANVLLHFGVMDELALPLLFRGLQYQSDWPVLEKGPVGNFKQGNFLHPFNLHKIFSDPQVATSFCYDFLLPLLQS